jgi:acyl-CoA reductase-like NAD-dependent aldehyde dehydrogenase
VEDAPVNLTSEAGQPENGKGAAAKRPAAARGESVPCHDPATLAPLGEVPVTPAAEVRQVVARARAAQQSWGRTTFAERRRVLGRVLEHLLDHADELCRLIARDAGKTLDNAVLGEVWPICEKLRHTIATGERDLAPEKVSPGLLLHKVAQIEYQPLGVIGVICPWNFPLQNVLGPTIPALMAGNAVVVKVSEWVAWSMPRIQQIFDSAFNECGYSTDIVRLMTGYAETGAALCESGVDKIVFTGSMPNGRRVAAQCAKTLTPVILELGGKDAMIVCDDAHLEQAVHAALAGTMISSGQMCLAAERVIVFARVHDELVERVVAEVGKLRQGPPLGDRPVDVGAMTMPHQVEIVERLVRDAVDKGASVRIGGQRADGLGGQYFMPTVLTGVTPEMAIAREETFGPVVCIFKVQDEDEAVRLANVTEYGLGSTVFTTSTARARRITAELRAGSTVVNDFGLAYMANALPFGGVGGSGYGRLNGREGLRAMCNQKSVLRDRFPLHRAIKLYPVQPGDYDRSRAVVELLYRRDLGKRAAALVSLVRHAFRR